MKYINIRGSENSVSVIGIGTMRIAGMNPHEVDTFVHTALDNGINFFDHADIYGGGKSEEVFGDLLEKQPELRDKMFIQSKCGIRNGYFDFSKEHILNSVDGILKRLRTDHIDSLLLHRPDALMEPEEVEEAFSQLSKAGKVRYFGVSNHNPFQMELLKSKVTADLW
jgi:predicted oxidoreductase